MLIHSEKLSTQNDYERFVTNLLPLRPTIIDEVSVSACCLPVVLCTHIPVFESTSNKNVVFLLCFMSEAACIWRCLSVINCKRSGFLLVAFCLSTPYGPALLSSSSSWTAEAASLVLCVSVLSPPPTHASYTTHSTLPFFNTQIYRFLSSFPLNFYLEMLEILLLFFVSVANFRLVCLRDKSWILICC